MALCDLTPDCISSPPSLFLLLRLGSLLSLVEFLISTPQMEHAFLPPLGFAHVAPFSFLREVSSVWLVKNAALKGDCLDWNPGSLFPGPLLSWTLMVMTMMTTVMSVTVSPFQGFYED